MKRRRRKRSSKVMKIATTRIAYGIAFLAGLAIGSQSAYAYPTYSEEEEYHPAGSSRCRESDTEGCYESVGYCKTCHGHFRATNEENSRPMLRDEYISPTDGKPWETTYQEVEADEPEEEIGLHDIHRHVMLDKFGSSRCDTCHMSDSRYPVFTFLSAGGGGVLPPIGCVGCHGRSEDAGHDSESPGRGAGLRQHHTNAGVAECKSCHSDADPANYTPVGENVPPPYYFTPDDVFINKPTDPCNQHREEQYAGRREGLDNDGDGRYDMRDRDCRR